MIQIQCIALVHYANLKKPSLLVSLFLYLLHLFQNHLHLTFCLHSVWGQIHRWISKVAKLFAMQTWTCQMFYTRRITKFFSFTQKKRVNRDIFGKIIENGGCFPHLYWTEFRFLCNYLLQFFCENSSLNWAIFTERVFFVLVLKNFTQAKNTLHECHLWQILRLL